MTQTNPPSQPPSTSEPRTERGSEATEKNRYRATLNLPATAFPMKANLVQNEPASAKRWDRLGVYERLRERRASAPKFCFHDGPPYANGSIHLGHLMNKCLKDFVVRTRTLMGFDCPYVPGWDCHGLPIEHKVMTELMDAGKLDKLRGLPEGQRRMAVRRECQKYAEKYVKLQAGEMIRLLTLADYAHPYLTMSREYEGATLEVLAGLCEQGLVYRALKPVHWSIANETALAEAELEYYDRVDPSVYVDFEAEDADAVYDAFGLARDENAEEDGDGEEGAEHEPDAEGPENAAGSEHKGDGEKSRLPTPGVRPTVRPTFMIWTTTPWTLPANLAIAVNEKFEYALVYVDGNYTVMAADAVKRVTDAADAEDIVEIARTTGAKLVGLRYRHAFIKDQSEHVNRLHHRGQGPSVAAVVTDSSPCFTLVAADYVTLEDGTGLVHTAPGHGTEDYQTGLRVGLPIYCPVQGNGTYDDTVPDWLRGKDIWTANKEVVDHLRSSGHLFYTHNFSHSYPHDWRGKTPVIFRCTEQWFIRVDGPTKREGRSLRDLALGSVSEAGAARGEGVKFVPEWGRNRMRGMLESRPDWCISRQRAWGLPIPAFLYTDPADGSEKVFMTAATVRAVAKVVREKGSDAWFQVEAADLLKHYDPAADPDCPPALRTQDLRKGPDILDVWFESGSSWNAVMRERRTAWQPGRDNHHAHTDLYLEGSDQHRGWFQASLLLSLGASGASPFATLLTHGFMVDKDGHKMSKSLGNTLNVEDLLKDFGADVCRWWVASLAYENDVKVDRDYFAVAGESYRKVRNTLRFLLSNLADFAPSGAPGDDPRVPLAQFTGTDLDTWVLGEFNTLSGEVLGAYERFDFKAAHARIYDFCNDTLSATYLAAIKDRLYCDKADSARRRRTQTAIWNLTDGLCRLLAPILPHTADEAFRALHRAPADDASTCVHLEEALKPFGVAPDPAWRRVLAVRERAMLAIEKAKAQPTEGGLGVENPLDTGVVLPDPDGSLARFDRADLADLLGVSLVTLDPAAAEPRVLDRRDQPRCERSWKRDGTVKRRSDGGMLSDRDAAAVGGV